MYRKSLAATLAALVLSACMPSVAAPLVQMEVLQRDSGQPLPRHFHRGQQWIAGLPGSRYSVRLSNRTGERVLVVLSVDGVNAVTGESANPSQTGYVLGPWQTTEVAGWRKSLDGIAQFEFTDAGSSYASRTGRGRDVGVIGIAVFEEAFDHRRYPRNPSAVQRQESHEGASASAAAPAEASDSLAKQQQRLGTGHGAPEWSPVGQTYFARGSSRPAQLTELRYDAPERLIALGILPAVFEHQFQGESPRAFGQGFVADPW